MGVSTLDVLVFRSDFGVFSWAINNSFIIPYFVHVYHTLLRACKMKSTTKITNECLL